MIRNQKDIAGFTLVEIAIVLVVIGLLIGSVIKGQELLDNVRMNRAIKQVENITAAAITFHDTYAAYPGDMEWATSRLPGCFLPRFSGPCQDGDGDRIIGWKHGSGITESHLDFLPAGFAVETVMFWQHMLQADLISGISGYTATPTLANSQFGVTHPASDFTGGLFVAHFDGSDENNGGIREPWRSNIAHGHHLIFRNNLTGTVGVGLGGGATPFSGSLVVSPYQHMRIDRKLDDNDPFAGEYWIMGLNECFYATFDETSRVKDCLFLARLKI